MFLCNLATFVFKLESLVHLLLLGLNIYVDLFQLSYFAVVFHCPHVFLGILSPFFRLSIELIEYSLFPSIVWKSFYF